MDLSEIRPFVRYARVHSNLPRKNKLSQCYDCRLFYIRSGCGELIANGENHHFSENTAIYLPPRTKYRIVTKQAKEPFSILIFNFDLVEKYSHITSSLGTVDVADFQPNLCPNYPIPEDFSHILVRKAPQLHGLLSDCTELYLKGVPYHRDTASASIKICLIDLLRSAQQDTVSQTTSQIIDYIHRNYHDPTLSNLQIATEFGYHPNYLSHLFREDTGKTLHSFLLQYRISIAKNYLITTDMDIETVSWKCGFNSSTYFIKQFRLQTGTTPKQYRKARISLSF